MSGPPSLEAGDDGVPPKGLQAGAIGLVSNVVIGLASTAPAYSLAVTLGLIVAAVGVHAPAVMLLALIPNFCIAVAADQLNRARPDCGSSFAWTMRAFGPRVGWITAWAMLMTDVIVMATFAEVVARYGLLLIGADRAADDARVVAMLGVGWITCLTWLSIRKIQVSVFAQRVWVGFEIAVLVAFAAVALVRVHGGSAPATAMAPHWAWFDPSSLDLRDGARGMLAALFMYWGWDTSFAVNEETARCERIPGRAAVLSTGLLALLFALVATAALSFAGVDAHGLAVVGAAPSDDVFAALASAVFGAGVLTKVLLLATLSSAIASAQTTILPGARLVLSMSVHRALPVRFAAVDPIRFTPTVATVSIGLASTIVFLALAVAGRDVLETSIGAITILISFYYALTGFACAWTFRRVLFVDRSSFLMKGLLPLVGAVVLTVAMVVSVRDLFGQQPDQALLWGVGCPLAVLLLALTAGLAVMAACDASAPGFFRRDPTRR